jgi:hypothetical protein
MSVAGQLLIFIAPAAVINVKDQHKDRVRTLCGPRLPTVFTVPSDSRQQNTQKQQQLQQQQSIPQQKNWQYMHRPEGSYYTVMRTSGGGGDSRQTQRTSGGGGDSRQTQQPTQVSSASMYSGYATASSQNTRYSTNAHTMSPHQGPHSQMGMPRNQSPYNNSTGRVMMSPAGSSVSANLECDAGRIGLTALRRAHRLTKNALRRQCARRRAIR